MGKGATFVILYSIFLLALFSTMCYLMTWVNPERPKKPDSKKALREGETEAENISRRIDDNEANNTENLNQQQADSNKTVSVSLRAESSESNTTLERRNNVENMSSTETTDTLSSKPPTTSLLISSTLTTTAKYIILGTTNALAKNVSSTSSPVKGLRRSVKENDDNYIEEVKTDEESDLNSVILKIMDDNGLSRIEIKLGSSGLARRKNRSPGKKANSHLNMLIKHNDSAKLEKNRLPKNTVIKLMPDNSLIVNYDPKTSKQLVTNKNELEFKADTTNKSLSINFTTKADEVRKNITNNRSSVDEAVLEILKIKDVMNQSADILNDTNAKIKLKVLIDNKTETISNIGQFVNEENFTQDISDTFTIGDLTFTTEEYKTNSSGMIDNISLSVSDGKKFDIIAGFTNGNHLQQIDFTEFTLKNEVNITTVKANETATTVPFFDNEIKISKRNYSTLSDTDSTIVTLPVLFEGNITNENKGDNENYPTSSIASIKITDVTPVISNNVTSDGVSIQLTSRAKVNKQTATIDVRDLNDVNGNITKILFKRFNS